jgi:predicted membrane chloride channel (bestrophin family)
MLTLEIIDDNYEGTHIIEISSQGHTFMTLVVAFLLVSRVNIGLNRYNQARDCLGVMYRESRELIQSCCVFSNHTTDQVAKEWRNEVAYRTLLLLRLSMAVIDYPTTNVPAWDVSELRGAELEDIKASIFMTPEVRRWAHSDRSEWEETMRVPIRMAYLLRKSVHSQGRVLTAPLALAQENQMLASINSFMGGYYGIRKFMTTPVPFPLIQMARTFLFLYVFTVPFVLLRDDSSRFAHCFAVFLLTYGFMGLEVVAIELDNPFGDDPNDFDNL